MDVAEIQGDVTDELKKIQKEDFWQLFRYCRTSQMPIYMPMELILNLKKYVFLTCLRFKKKSVLNLLDHIISNCVYQIITWPILIPAVVSAGGRLTINASPPGWTLRSVAEREQFGCDQG